MKNTPIERNVIDETINEFQIVDFSKATIREVKAIASKAEAVSGVEFIKMEMGVPGLPASAVGVKAEIEALQNGIASLYPDINGLPELKKEASDFIKAFINVDLSPEGCVPVTGSMQGTFASFLTCSQCDEKKDTILFIDPGFPVQKQQLVVMGQKFETFDVYDYRGDKLKEKLESYLKTQNLLNTFANWAEKKGLKRRNNQIQQSKKLFEISLYGNIIYNMLGLESYIEYLNQTDQTVQKALEVLEEGKSFPVAPEQPATAKKEKHDQGKEKTTAQIDQPKEKAVSGPATYEVVFQLA